MEVVQIKNCLYTATIHQVNLAYYSLLAHLYTSVRRTSQLPFNFPTCSQRRASSTTRAARAATEGKAPSKTMAFLCFQSSHMTSVNRVRMSVGRCSALIWVVHQSLMVSSGVGAQFGLPIVAQIFAHKVRAKTKLNSRCSMVSSACAQNGHVGW
jgi:hypothetical protein